MSPPPSIVPRTEGLARCENTIPLPVASPLFGVTPCERNAERQPRCESSREQNAYGDENSPLPRWSLRLRDERIEREWKAWKMLHDWI